MSIVKSFIVIVNQNIFGTINNVKKKFKIFYNILIWLDITQLGNSTAMVDQHYSIFRATMAAEKFIR